MAKNQEAKKCKHCGETKIEGQSHRHCGECGCIIRKGKTRHRADCPRLDLDPRYYCGQCKRLLAAGAKCPEHGAARAA